MEPPSSAEDNCEYCVTDNVLEEWKVLQAFISQCMSNGTPKGDKRDSTSGQLLIDDKALSPQSSVEFKRGISPSVSFREEAIPERRAGYILNLPPVEGFASTCPLTSSNEREESDKAPLSPVSSPNVLVLDRRKALSSGEESLRNDITNSSALIRSKKALSDSDLKHRWSTPLRNSLRKSTRCKSPGSHRQASPSINSSRIGFATLDALVCFPSTK